MENKLRGLTVGRACLGFSGSFCSLLQLLLKPFREQKRCRASLSMREMSLFMWKIPENALLNPWSGINGLISVMDGGKGLFGSI